MVTQWFDTWTSNSSSSVTSGANIKVDDSTPGTWTTNGSWLRVYNWGTNQTLIPGQIVSGIEVRVDAWSDNADAGNYFNVDLSWDGGSSFTTVKRVPVSGGIGLSEQTVYVGGSVDTWGRTWTLAEIRNTANFQVRITYVRAAGTNGSVDYMAWRAYTSMDNEPWEIELPISASADDGTEEDTNHSSYVWTATGFDYNYTGHEYVNPDNFYANGGFTFRNVTIPAGSVITEARIGLAAYTSDNSYTILTKIWGVDVDDFAGFDDSSNKPSTLYGSSSTDAKVDWDVDSSVAWVDKTYYYTADFSSVVQEIVNRGGWASGQDIGIAISDDGSAANQTRAWYDYEGGPVPVLLVRYTTNKFYTKGNPVALPSDDANQATVYTSTDITYADVPDSDSVTQTGTTVGYVIHQFKNKKTTNTKAFTETWYGAVTKPGSVATIYLQVYNRNSTTWETLDSNSSVAANTSFVLSGTISSNLANYYDADNWISCRVYQAV